MKKHRRFYTEKKQYDITIIEIIEEDQIDENSFLEIEMNKNISIKENDNNIYVIHYPKGEEISVSPGRINNINNNNIFHSCSTDYGSSGGPILDKTTLKVIGIHKGHDKNNKKNVGSLIRKPIEEFNNKNDIQNKNNNELNNSKTDKKNIKNSYKNINDYNFIKKQIIINNKANNNKILDNKNNDEITIQYEVKNGLFNLFTDENIKNIWREFC